MAFSKTTLELRGLEVNHEVGPTSNLDFTSIGSVGTRFWRSRDVAKRIEKCKDNIIFYSNQPLDHQVPHDGWVILLDNGASLLVLLLGHEPNGILINIVYKHSSLKKS